jgi:hypothetical protein
MLVCTITTHYLTIIHPTTVVVLCTCSTLSFSDVLMSAFASPKQDDNRDEKAPIETDQLAMDFGGLCGNKKFSDVTFVVGSAREKFYAHRMLLAARSKVTPHLLLHNATVQIRITMDQLYYRCLRLCSSLISKSRVVGRLRSLMWYACNTSNSRSMLMRSILSTVSCIHCVVID